MDFFLSTLTCGWCSYLEVTAVLKPDHTQIWLLFRICFLFYTPSCPNGVSAPFMLVKSGTFWFCIETLIYQVVPYLWRNEVGM